MGIINFLKKALAEAQEKVEEKTKVVETRKELTLDEIKTKIISEQKEIEGSSEKLKKEAKILINETIPLLKEQVNPLKKVNLDKRKEEVKLKEIVMENVSHYISYLEKLIETLGCLDSSVSLNDYLSQMSKAFESFSKNSSKSYQRATILVGKEFETIPKILKGFVEKYNVIANENLKNNTKTLQIEKIKDNFAKIDEIDRTIGQIKDNIFKLNKQKKQNELDITKKQQEIEDITKSEAYKNDLTEKENVKKQIKELEKEITNVLEKINLKELAKIYHSSEKKHKIIRKYAENYKRAIEEDKEREFEKIVKETRGIEVDLFEINDKIKKLSQHFGISEAKINKIKEEIAKINREAIEISENISEEEKKLIRFKEKRLELENNLKLL